MSEKTKSDSKKTQEPKLEETKKLLNQRADTMPTNGFVLSVDGKLKTQYETAEEATTAAMKLKETYPVIKVAVYDAAARVSTAV